MLKNVMTFINTIIEAPEDKQQRLELKEDLVVHGISVVYNDIQQKIKDKDYTVEGCSFASTLSHLKRRRQTLSSRQ
jgi:hypothetical protein